MNLPEKIYRKANKLHAIGQLVKINHSVIVVTFSHKCKTLTYFTILSIDDCEATVKLAITGFTPMLRTGFSVWLSTKRLLRDVPVPPE